MRIRNGDIELEVTVDGSNDAPPVVLLHGIISSSRTWDWIVPHLARTRRAIRVDFRGHGGSDRAPGEYHMANYVSDAVAACEQVAGVPAPVIGHSLGGATAAALAQQRPDLVRGILLEDAPLSDLERGDGDDAAGGSAEENALLAAFRLMRESIPQLQANGVTADQLAQILTAMPSASGATFGEILLADGIRTMAVGMLKVDASVLDGVLDGTIVRNFDPDRPINVPVTAIAADPSMPDAVTQPADLDQLAATSPTVETVTMAGAGHLIHDSTSARDDFRAMVDRFLARVD
jgi:esterase